MRDVSIVEIEQPSRDRFKTAVAILIAATSIIGALVAWRLAVASGEAGGEDAAGLTAVVNVENVRTLGENDAYKEYSAYTRYERYNRLGDLISRDEQDLPDDERAALERQKREAWDLALGIEGTFFDSRYLTPEGRFDLDRRLGEAAVFNEHNLDTDPESHFAEADDARDEARWLAGLLIALAFALLLFTLARRSDSVLRYYSAACGVLVMIGALATAVAVDRFLY